MKNTVIDELKAIGLKATKARVTMLELFNTAKNPLDAEMIKEHLDKKSISADVATIYRFLNKFVEEGILKQVELGEGKYRYELASLPHHHHLVCTCCGNIDDIEDCDVELLEEKVAKKRNFIVNAHRLELFGLCKNCH